MQVGLGVAVGSIDVIHTAGQPAADGYSDRLGHPRQRLFRLQGRQHQLYTRAGVFDFEEAGWLVAPNGMRVAGWNADSDGSIDTNQALQEIRVPSVRRCRPGSDGKRVLGRQPRRGERRRLSRLEDRGSRSTRWGTASSHPRVHKDADNEWSWEAQDDHGQSASADYGTIWSLTPTER